MSVLAQALVEADEERPVALAGEPASLLGRQHRLAGAGRPDDLHRRRERAG